MSILIARPAHIQSGLIQLRNAGKGWFRPGVAAVVPFVAPVGDPAVVTLKAAIAISGGNMLDVTASTQISNVDEITSGADLSGPNDAIYLEWLPPVGADLTE